MAWGKKKNPGYSYFMAGTALEGRLCFNGLTLIDGQVNGQIVASGTLVVGETAVIIGDVLVENIILNGTVHGSINAFKHVQLNAPARVYGHISYSELSIEGALHEGSSHKLTPEEIEATQRECLGLMEEISANAERARADRDRLTRYVATPVVMLPESGPDPAPAPKAGVPADDRTALEPDQIVPPPAGAIETAEPQSAPGGSGSAEPAGPPETHKPDDLVIATVTARSQKPARAAGTSAARTKDAAAPKGNGTATLKSGAGAPKTAEPPPAKKHGTAPKAAENGDTPPAKTAEPAAPKAAEHAAGVGDETSPAQVNDAAAPQNAEPVVSESEESQSTKAGEPTPVEADDSTLSREALNALPSPGPEAPATEKAEPSGADAS